MFRCTVSFALCLMAATVASAQETQREVLRYDAIMADGKLTIVPHGSDSETTPESKGATPSVNTGGNDSESVDAMLKGVPGTSAGTLDLQGLEKILGDQVIYVGKDPKTGEINSVWTVPKGAQVPAGSIFASAPPGTEFTAASGNWLARLIFPDRQQLVEAMGQFLEDYRQTVCRMPARPTTFGAAIDLKAGWGIEGGIQLNATWEAKDLCKAIDEANSSSK